jgi:hypothetical protein
MEMISGESDHRLNRLGLEDVTTTAGIIRSSQLAISLILLYLY